MWGLLWVLVVSIEQLRILRTFCFRTWGILWLDCSSYIFPCPFVPLLFLVLVPPWIHLSSALAALHTTFHLSPFVSCFEPAFSMPITALASSWNFLSISACWRSECFFLYMDMVPMRGINAVSLLSDPVPRITMLLAIKSCWTTVWC